MAIDLSRVRDTSATARRFENIKTIISTLRERTLTRVDVQALLAFSPSGSRKYVRELVSAGVMVIAHTEEVARISNKGHIQLDHHFKLTDDEEIIANVLALVVKESNNKTKEEKPKERVLTGDPSRHFHIISDDTYYAVKVPHKRIPAPDPVLAHLFGLAQVEV